MIFDRIKAFFKNLFNKDIKEIDSPEIISKAQEESKINSFEESLKIELNETTSDDVSSKKNESSSSNNSQTIIETLRCEGDGTGFQKIKNY